MGGGGNGGLGVAMTTTLLVDISDVHTIGGASFFSPFLLLIWSCLNLFSESK